ncbi:CDP-glycerol glycerophosphotransferase family protein [uncultured Tolumonas sp.]|uniref:CDP-glycerol glycerophosphotransferase family protein n=1 Tax=uncultured Tolumonas sp. TaxID=263765 RepID=UPI002A0A29B8|nr:CDP-glycerol glycerophosphotransferase family protein [uncultured Tolumonas sp.]
MDINQGFRKLAFFVHTAEMYHHYKSVWRLLGPDGFDVVLHGTESAMAESRALIGGMGYSCHDSAVILSAGHYYDVVVSNHSLFTYGERPLIQALGRRQVRFMYALGKAKHNFSAWNQHYDLILCFGPWQAERMKECCSAVTFQMGYPRYDDYFRQSELQHFLPTDLGLDPNKKTVLWLPTWRGLSSLRLFSDAMSNLIKDYNVIVKTHPLSVSAEPDALKVLQQYPFTAVITHVYDNLDLFRCADFVVCDYGGTPFGALYLDKNLLLLNVPNAAANALTGENSPDVDLRQDIVSLDASERWRISEILQNKALWSEQVSSRSRLRRRFFSASYGFSAELAVLAIKNIKNLIRQG